MKKYNEKGEYIGEVDQTKYAETLNKDRQKAEGQQMELEFQRVLREGVNGVEDLVTYLVYTIEDAKHMENFGRLQNNPIIYSEAIGIRREMEKLLKLVMQDGTAQEVMEGTEEKHRENNSGEEGYQ